MKYQINKTYPPYRPVVRSGYKKGRAYFILLACILSFASMVNISAQEKFAAAADSLPLPEYHCKFIGSNLIISGRIDDPLWIKAEIIHLNDPIIGKPGRFDTKVRLLYSADYLYIAFECEDDYVWGTFTEHDANIFTEECVEMFLCPSGRMRQYYELNVSPLNTVFDTFILNGRSTTGKRSNILSWTDFTCAGMMTKVHINGEIGVRGSKGWSAEYAIPFSSILGSDNISPLPSECWKVNFYRIDTPEPKKMEFYSWSPTGANDYHRPWRFGTLKFIKP